jgi:hypothetical protein
MGSTLRTRMRYLERSKQVLAAAAPVYLAVRLLCPANLGLPFACPTCGPRQLSDRRIERIYRELDVSVPCKVGPVRPGTN